MLARARAELWLGGVGGTELLKIKIKIKCRHYTMGRRNAAGLACTLFIKRNQVKNAVEPNEDQVHGGYIFGHIFQYKADIQKQLTSQKR